MSQTVKLLRQLDKTIKQLSDHQKKKAKRPGAKKKKRKSAAKVAASPQ